MVIWAGVGGRMSLMGAIIGAFMIRARRAISATRCSTTWLLMLGGFFILVVRFLPKGLIGLVESAAGAVPVGGRRHNGDRRHRRRRLASSGRTSGAAGMGFLEIKNLCKSFDTVGVINDFSVEMVEATLCCLVGPNGAGKTTTMDLITGRQKPTSGSRSCSATTTSPDWTSTRSRGAASAANSRCRRCFKDLSVRQNLEVASAAAPIR